MDMVRLDPPAELTMPTGEAMFTQNGYSNRWRLDDKTRQ